MFKRYLPTSLFGRALLIVVLPVLLLQAVVAGLFIQRHFDGVTRQMAEAVARELVYAANAVDRAADLAEARRDLAALEAPLSIRFTLDPDAIVAPAEIRALYDLSGDALADTLEDQIDRPIALDLVSRPKQVVARLQTTKGELSALIDRRRMVASNPHQLLVVTGLASVALIAVAMLFLRNQVRPIRELAAAADAFGKGRAVPFRPAGAEEVRRAGSAFLAMRARIERQIESRMRMLSGVSHDLRTPLTRMKLAVAMLDEGPETAELAEDVREMERMIDAFLAFVRGEAGEETAEVDALALAEEVAGEARRSGAVVAVSVEGATGPAPLARMRRGAVKRALQNLVENAAAFGARIELRLKLRAGMLEYSVEDDGPGIPEADRAAAVRPFVRLDAARNQDRGGGVGLGLSIAEDVARAHGGALRLGASARLGGLRARLRLPR
jgi:two-component system osmolarity sensor histidine kinase EnvZ